MRKLKAQNNYDVFNMVAYFKRINSNMISMKKTVKVCGGEGFRANQETYKLPNIQYQKSRTIKFLAFVEAYI